ncbi:antitoxin Xre/MbcA/ParS toxin-binding domain-containing protein [Fuerstiella marisgermanici]|uniref:antitoxin Xre/MbcA/ParS toxin-binding domain-containing protein n=1 Tax=Fuerstiella marisgermanici TaxID=1891926 RepID=UPI00097BC0B2|nr:antitoxin Xre/MbcA/ParS toxin-binding domain-containing protein [Fuerstiella marisgermanici]
MQLQIEIPDRTLARRKDGSPEPFMPGQSEQLIRLVRAMDRATEVLEDPDKARAWMMQTNVALNGERPPGLLGTSVGFEVARDVRHHVDYAGNG